MPKQPNEIVNATVFYPTPVDFKRGKQYDIVCVFYTSDGEELPLPGRVLTVFLSAFDGFMKAKPARTDLNLPALKIQSCALFKPNGLKHLANLVACVYGKIYGVRINVMNTPITLC